MNFGKWTKYDLRFLPSIISFVLAVLLLIVPAWYIYHFPQQEVVQSRVITKLAYPSYSIKELSPHLDKKHREIPTMKLKKATRDEYQPVIIYYLDKKVRHKIYQLSPTIIHFESPQALTLWENTYLPYWNHIYQAKITEVVKGKYQVELVGWKNGIIISAIPSFVFLVIGVISLLAALSRNKTPS